MATAAELLQAYREHGGLDAEETIAFLMDFLATYGITDSAADVLCDYIDDEGMTEDFASQLRENGLILEPGGAGGEKNGLSDDE